MILFLEPVLLNAKMCRPLELPHTIQTFRQDNTSVWLSVPPCLLYSASIGQIHALVNVQLRSMVTKLAIEPVSPPVPSLELWCILLKIYQESV